VVNGTLTWLAFTPGSRAPLFVGLALALVVMTGAVVLVRRHRRSPVGALPPGASG
jgi:hypothetical protein